MAQKLPPQARRLRTIIVTVPIMGATAYVLYERLVLGKPRRTLPRESPQHSSTINELLPENSNAGSEHWSKGE
ncbi:uncharacterized protein EDB91DRAFT_1222722 [Suillus paluster]|uniref:uncharacterized protein n=1 Tax=Suillus paluster TaxID=48578 RepID=UPI001B878593|nr:uncharacterized protein EDB91DRAFT_1222722 [Suillus paluster]KAG1740402.1 hypothetical protein EDB91DRAFT_1222722 [Suillus paluster]